LQEKDNVVPEYTSRNRLSNESLADDKETKIRVHVFAVMPMKRVSLLQEVHVVGSMKTDVQTISGI
jgi:hypothetical protein